MPFEIDPAAIKRLRQLGRYTLRGAMAHIMGGTYQPPQNLQDAVWDALQESCPVMPDGGILRPSKDASFKPLSAQEALIDMLRRGQALATGVQEGRIEDIPKEFWGTLDLEIDWSRDGAGFRRSDAEDDDLIDSCPPPNGDDEVSSKDRRLVKLVGVRWVPYASYYTDIRIQFIDIVSEKRGDERLEQPDPPRERWKPGPKPKYDWRAFGAECMRLLDHHGLPTPGDPDLPNQAALERLMAEWCRREWDDEPSDSMIREHVASSLREHSEQKSGQN